MDRTLEQHEKTGWLIVFGLILFVIALSLLIFSSQSIRLDESQSLWQTSHTPLRIFNIIAQDVHVPFYHVILHFWQLFLGNTVFTGRMLSLVFFVLAIPTLYVLGKRIFNPSIGLFAALLFAISPFMNWYGNEIRMYSLFTLLTILNQYFFIRIYRVRDADSWLGYALTAVFGMFTHYFFFFVLLTQAIFYLVYRDLFAKRTLIKFIIVAIIVVASFAPWIYYVKQLSTIQNQAPLLQIPTTVNIFNAFSQFLFGFQNDHLNTILVSLWPLTVLFGFLALRENKKVSPETVYVLMSVLVPIAAAFVLSLTVRPVFVSRYLILTIPSMYLFIGWIFSTYPKTLERSLKALLVILMLAGLTVEAVNPSSPVKENYREATEYLETNAAPQDIIILSAPFTVYPIEYYYRGPTEINTLPIWSRFQSGPIPPFNAEQLPKDVETLKGTHDRAFLLLSYDQGYEQQIHDYFQNNFHLIEQREFSPGLNLYVYQFGYHEPVFGN